MDNASAMAQFMSRDLARQKTLKLLADEDADDDLLVINDADGARLLMDVWNTYVSEYNFGKFPAFMRKVDRLLYQVRGNKAFTHEERQAAEEAAQAAAPVRRGGKKKRRTASPDAAPPVNVEVQAMADFIGNSLRAA
jgi:hypothetical protein